MIDQERQGWTSASNALADSLCPGRHMAQAGLPDVETKYATSGSRVHLALADPTAVEVTQNFTPAERDIYEACREVEKAKVLEFFPDSGQESGPDRRMKVFREHRYWCTFQGPDGRTYKHSGKLDVLYRQSLRALIVEYKTLPGDVPDSPRNLQLRDQMELAWGNLVTVEEIGVVVVQPLVTRDPQICVYRPADRLVAQRQMFERIVASNQPDAPRIAGDVQCNYCKAKLQCAAYQKFASQMAPPALLPVLEVPIASWTPQQRSQVMNALKAFEKFSDEIKEHIKTGLGSDPEFCPGWTLKPGAMRESISDPQKCFERFAALGGKLEQFMESVNVGKMALKAAVQSATGTKGKALEKKMAELLDGIVEQSRTAPSLKKVEAE